MRYRKLKAAKIFNGVEFLDENQVLIVTENGIVEKITSQADAGDDVELLDGILTPGFINCHCHIELSHMKDVIPPYTGLVDFLLAVIKNRSTEAEQIEESIAAAEEEMYANGIVGVADICNTPYAIAVKKQSSLRWHNLVEVINLHDSNLEKQLAHYNAVLDQYQSLPGNSVLTPHAPYTVSAATYKAINAATANQIISIHNQETEAEAELFQKGTGNFLKLYAQFGSHQSPFAVSSTSSLQTYLPYFTNGQTVLLVHNTFITEDDILFAKEHAEKHGLTLVYCLCPNANKYIENAMPPVELLMKHDCHIVLGTDSYSSNWQLNIASEIKTLLTAFPKLSLEAVLKWATYNGAVAMQWHDMLGSFEKGKKPGVVVLDEKKFTSQRIV